MARVIKAEALDRSPANARRVDFNFEDLTHRADSFVDDVRRRAAQLAEQIVAEARKEAERIRRQAEAEGQKSARESAQRTAEASLRSAEEATRSKLEKTFRERLDTLLPALAQAASELQVARQEWRARWEQNLLQLACALAERIVRRELTRDPEVSLNWMREALELASGAAQVRLRLHPSDHETLGDRAKLLTERFAGAAAVEVVADPGVTLGGCRVTTEFGAIDLQLETQIARLRDELS